MAGPARASPIIATIPARAVVAAPASDRTSRGPTDRTLAAAISSSPANDRPAEGVRGSLRDSATASVAGIRDVRSAAHHADTSTTTARRSTAASAGRGLKVSGSEDGSMPADTSSRRKRSASR